jgi:tRNA threonylcarbamoyladenosine modification (KEOPS) complex  Pcc1 subunit
VSLLRPSDIDKRAAYYHQESKGALGNATSKSTLAAQEMAKPLALSDHNTQMLHSTYFIETQNVDYLYRSITPELETIAIAGTRSSVTVRETAEKLIIEITASDVASCRSATNSWLRLALIATEVDELVADTLKELSETVTA